MEGKFFVLIAQCQEKEQADFYVTRGHSLLEED